MSNGSLRDHKNIQQIASTQEGDIHQSVGNLTINKSFNFFSGNWISIILVGILAFGGAASLVSVTISINRNGLTINIGNH